MDVLGELVLMAMAGGVALWLGMARYRWRLKIWREAAAAARLRLVESPGPRAWSQPLEARASAVKVRFEPSHRRGDEGTRVVVAVPGPPGFARVCIRRETDIRWAGEMEVGDKRFDATFVVEGPPRLVRALLDAETRRLLNRLNAASEFVISGGEIRVLISETKLRGFLPQLVQAGEQLAKRLAAEVDAPGRLSENAKGDPVAGVRLQNLLLLVRELRDSPETAEALRAAGADASPQVRLRAAIELGPEGRGILAELAEGAADDAASAGAVVALGRELPGERTRAILARALGRRHLQTARACLEALGQGGGEEAVEMLAKVMAREWGELAVVAAAALAETCSPEAEPPLLAALAREQPDLQVAVAQALARIGSAAAVLPLKEAAERVPRDRDLERVVRQAVAEIQSRLQGASPGQLSLAGAETGRLSLAPAEEGRLSLAPAGEGQGQLSLATDPAVQLSLPAEEAG